MTISKDGATHKLKIHKVSDEFAGKYKFEADGRKTEAMIIVEGVFYPLICIFCVVHINIIF